MEIVLNSYGVSLNRDNEAFVIKSDEGKQRVPPQGIKSILIGKGSQITSDAIMLAVENEIEVIFSDKAGNVVARVWSPKYGSISTIRKGQLNFTSSHAAVDWIKDVICQKIENQQALMLSLIENEALKDKVSKSINKLESLRKKIKDTDSDQVRDIAPSLRGFEGQASKAYFTTMNYILPEKLRFKERSQHPAKDAANALLNYGYGLLYGKIESALIRAGIDPYIGIMHRDNFNRPVLVYDVIELYRVWIDYVVYNLMAQGAVNDEFFSVKEDGSCWLEPLGRRILIQSVNDYMEDKIQYNGQMHSRSYVLDDYAFKLAKTFKKHEK